MAIIEVIPSQGDLGKGETLGTVGEEGVANIEMVPLEDSFGVLKAAALGTG